MKNINIGIYSPYLDILGGGERYVFTLAEYLSRKYKVFLYGKQEITELVRKQFQINLQNIVFISPALFKKKNPLSKLLALNNFHIFFYLTDGSIFFSPCRKNILLIQSPMHIPYNTLSNKLKLLNWEIVCNSLFTQSQVQEKLGCTSSVLYPPVDTGILAIENQKEDIILSVGRLYSPLHKKNHSVLIDAFKKNYLKYFKDWKLIIVGGVTQQEGQLILGQLKKEAKGYPIEIKENISYQDLRELYNKAKIYWHATGFGEDVVKYPEKAEHFGITTVEAMASKTIPIAFSSGGQKEIIADGIDGFLWNTVDELVEKSNKIMRDSVLYNKISQTAWEKANKFSKEKFYEKVEKLIP